ncbi:E1A-binding protein p400-like [Petromyzon marinus]|uniref:E1A-binding protein p400-like n=2 Tax=Petromyzon marinus TaxID=7757 RepID=UPI003F7026AB
MPPNIHKLLKTVHSMLSAIQQLLELPLNLALVSPAHTPNWELVSDVVNVVSRVYRSPKHCRSRYEAVVVPREEGKLLYDFHPKKKQKTKGVYKTKSRQPLCTSQIFAQDEHTAQTELFSAKFELARSSAAKRRMSLKPVLGTNLFQKNPKHVSVPSESGISYETPLSPVQVAALRAERIAKEKKLRKAEHKMDGHKCE